MVNTRNILLIGRVNNGKTTLGNVICGEDKFVASTIKETQIEEIEVDEIKYKIIDVVEMDKTSRQQILSKLTEISYFVEEGLNQIFFITDGKFTEEEVFVYNLLRTVIFDDNIIKYTTIIRTKFSDFLLPEKCAEDKEKMVKENEEFSDVIVSCNKVIHVNNINENQDKKGLRVKLITHLQTCQEIYKLGNEKELLHRDEKEKREYEARIQQQDNCKAS